MSRNPVAEKANILQFSSPGFMPSVVAIAILSLALGYWIGVGNSLLPLGSSKQPRKRRKAASDGQSSPSEFSSDDELDSRPLGHTNEECKMVHYRS